ncbi:MAG: hypothetical protein LBN22_02675 [Clostridiales Family XIII bacterium]|jgi:hypothetical protein|nr:hypothetical protein [Clostridiales Family XIII bacterium]
MALMTVNNIIIVSVSPPDYERDFCMVLAGYFANTESARLHLMDVGMIIWNMHEYLKFQ